MNDERIIVQTITFQIPNISCNHCVHTINMELEETEGVISATTNLETQTTTISFSSPANKESLVDLLSKINYPPEQK